MSIFCFDTCFGGSLIFNFYNPAEMVYLLSDRESFTCPGQSISLSLQAVTWQKLGQVGLPFLSGPEMG